MLPYIDPSATVPQSQPWISNDRGNTLAALDSSNCSDNGLILMAPDRLHYTRHHVTPQLGVIVVFAGLVLTSEELAAGLLGSLALSATLVSAYQHVADFASHQQFGTQVDDIHSKMAGAPICVENQLISTTTCIFTHMEGPPCPVQNSLLFQLLV
jgi:hypothetical protein